MQANPVHSLHTDQAPILLFQRWPVQPTCMSLSGSAHSRSHSSPLSGTSVGRATRLMSSRFLRSGDRPPCMHRICEATHRTAGAGQQSQETTKHNSDCPGEGDRLPLATCAGTGIHVCIHRICGAKTQHNSCNTAWLEHGARPLCMDRTCMPTWHDRSSTAWFKR